MSIEIIKGDNLEVLKKMEEEVISLIWTDPPFNTGKTQTLRQTRMKKGNDGTRKGYKGKEYSVEIIGKKSYEDKFDNFVEDFLGPRLELMYKVLKPNGSLFLHIDYREVHYVKIYLDKLFGRNCFINEIIWAYDYGARSRTRWSAKHDNILWYAKNPDDYIFNYDQIDRIPYMAPSLQTLERVEKGKTPTDVWWHTIVPPNSKERTGYPTQKPLGIVNRIVVVHSNPGDLLLDPFGGSGTLGESALVNGRKCILIDNNDDAVKTMQKRLSEFIKF